jgi:hypothetical protein
MLSANSGYNGSLLGAKGTLPDTPIAEMTFILAFTAVDDEAFGQRRVQFAQCESTSLLDWGTDAA